MKTNKKILGISIFAVIAFGLFFSSVSPKTTMAQLSQCISYIPVIFQDGDPGTTASRTLGGECAAVPLTTSFGGVLAQPPIAALQGFDFRFTGGHHSFGLGAVKLNSVSVVSSSNVQINVQGCFRDEDTSDSRSFQFWYAVANWVN